MGRANSDYRALKRLVRGVHQYKNAWDHPWEWLGKAIDPQGLFTDEEMGSHLFADEFSDRREYETYLRAFIEGAIGAWQGLAPHVEADESAPKDAKDYLPELGPCVASQSTAEPAESGEPESAPSRRSAWRPIDTITRVVNDAAGMAES